MSKPKVKVLYSELTPVILMACECRKEEPFLMMFRSLTQVIQCDHCKQDYGVVYGTNSEGKLTSQPVALPKDKVVRQH